MWPIDSPFKWRWYRHDPPTLTPFEQKVADVYAALFSDIFTLNHEDIVHRRRTPVRFERVLYRHRLSDDIDRALRDK